MWLLLLGLFAFALVGAFLGKEFFRLKNRDPLLGVLIGGISGLFLVLLIVFLIGVMILPPLEPGDPGFFPPSTTLWQRIRELGEAAKNVD